MSSNQQEPDTSERLQDYFLQMDGQNILLYYKGPFDEEILTRISRFLKGGLTSSPKAGQRLFSIFIELAQNIAYYSSEVSCLGDGSIDRGIGTVMVSDKGAEFEFTAGNLIDKNNVEDLIKKCDEINQLDYDGLRALKRQVRSNPRKEGHKGGNIGLIQVALKSQSPLRVYAKPVDTSHAFFTISTVIEKS